MTCSEGWRLQDTWYKTRTEQAKAAYARHLCTCPDCRPHPEQWANLQYEYDDAAIEAAYNERMNLTA